VTFVPVYKCMHIYDSLSSAAEFESYYQHTRQVSLSRAGGEKRRRGDSCMPEPQGYCAHRNGFCIICSCKRISCCRAPLGLPSWRAQGHTSLTFTRLLVFLLLRPTPGTRPIISSPSPRYYCPLIFLLPSLNPFEHLIQVKSWWEAAAHRLRATLHDQVTTYCRDVAVLQRLGDFVFLFMRTVSAYGFDVTLLQDFFKMMRDKYIELATQSYRTEFLKVPCPLWWCTYTDLFVNSFEPTRSWKKRHSNHCS